LWNQQCLENLSLRCVGRGGFHLAIPTNFLSVPPAKRFMPDYAKVLMMALSNHESIA
jgi:hypothetical protein